MNNFAKLAIAGATALTLAGCQSMYGDTSEPMSASASSDVTLVGGAEMYPTRNIVENAVNSPIHTTLVKAVTAAGLATTLSGPGPFTVFAPTDAAFGKVPEATLATLMTPAGKPALTKVLTYHVVPGRITAADLVSRIQAGNGTAMITTVEGEQLTFTMRGSSVRLMGKGGSSAAVTQADVMQSNGVIHVVDGVLLPTL